jgi:16S rRNA (guanine527-N7)-methyltransferase
VQDLSSADAAVQVAEPLGTLAREIGVELDAAQCARLEQFVRLLVRWNRVHNLTAITSEADMLTHHLLDSLSAAGEMRMLAGSRPDPQVLDVGAGAGLPGIPLAVAMPQFRFTLNDAVSKKCAFMTQAKLELGLANVQIVHRRVEQLHGTRFDIIVSRALASLAGFTGLTRHLLAPGGHWIAMKGAEPLQELQALPPHVEVLRTVTLRVPRLDEARHLVVMQAH